MNIDKLRESFGSWYEFFELHKVFLELEGILINIALLYETTTVYPKINNIFRAFTETSFNDCSVVILGQDPYPGVYKNIPSACGVAFATENGYINPSLRKIFECLQKDKLLHHNITNYDGSLLLNWCKQGVLLLNTALTVEAGIPGSHMKIWSPFINKFIVTLSKYKPDIVWVLMGREAQKYTEHIQTDNVIMLPHPMADIYSGRDEFVNSGLFSKINNKISDNSNKTIVWN